MHERQLLSTCCDSKTYFIPASLGDPEMYLCQKCNKLILEGDTKVVEAELFRQIAKGVYRPVKNL